MATGLVNFFRNRMPQPARIAVILAVFLLPWLKAHALGLGAVNVSSAINEPLVAEIELLNLQGLQQSELIVSLGAAVDYSLAGVRYHFSHAELEFEPDFSNPARPVVWVTTARPITEPYMNFVVQARWPAGRILREYTLLLDLPVFSGERAQTTPAVAPASRPSTTVPAPAPVSRPSVMQPVQVTSSSSASAPAAPAAPAGTYRVQFGDTLWKIAQIVANQAGITQAQAMLALRDLNPAAFMDGNLNRLMSGSLLRIPTSSQVTVRDAEQARAQIASELGLDGSPVQSGFTSQANTSSSSAGGQFRLAGSSIEGAATSEGNADTAQLLSENAVLKEELDAAELENANLRERLAQLEEQISVLERLVEVEDADLAQAQNLTNEQSAPAQLLTPQVSLFDRLMGWIQWIGIGLLGLLVAVYMVIKRRKDNAEELETSTADDDFDLTDAQDDEEELFSANSTDKQDEYEFDADATLVLSAAAGHSAPRADYTSEFELPADAAPEFEAAEEEDDTDFDDLDAFFSDLEDKGGNAAADDFDTDELTQDEKPTAGEPLSSDMDFDLGDELDEAAEKPNTQVEPLTDDSAEAGLDFSLGAVEEPSEDDRAPSGSPASAAADDNGLDFNLGGFSLGDESEESLAQQTDQEPDADNAEDIAEPILDSDDTGMDFDIALDAAPELASDPGLPTGDDMKTAADDAGMDFTPSTESSAPQNPEQTADEALDDLDAVLPDNDDDLDDSIFADLGEEDLDDLLGTGDSDFALGADEPAVELSSDSDLDFDLDATPAQSEDATAETVSLDDDDLSSFTAMLDSSDEPELPESNTADPFGDDDLSFDLDEGDSSDSAAECATKLELAEAYLDLGDETGARTLLKEVAASGTNTQVAKAQELLGKLS